MAAVKPVTVVSILSENDAEDVEALFKRVWVEDAEEYPAGWKKRRALSKTQIVREMREGYCYFGVRVDNKLVGLYKSWLTPFGLFGEHQSVDPAHRKMGAATAMYNHFIDHARRRKCKRVCVNVLANHDASLKIMEKMGFHRVGPEFFQAEGMRVQIYCRRV